MKVLMLVSNEYRPDPRVRKEAVTLCSAGNEVDIVCWNRSGKLPKEDRDGAVKVRRVFVGKAQSAVWVPVLFPFFYIGAVLRSRGLDFDAVHCHDFDTLLAGLIISKLRGKPLIYDSHEWYSKMVEEDLPLAVTKVIEKIESFFVPSCDRVIAANDTIADHLRGCSATEPVVVMNCIELPEDGHRAAYDQKGKTVLYLGGVIEPGRYIHETLEAARLEEDCVLRIAGTGRLEPEVVQASKETGRIEFYGFLPPARLYEMLASSDASICLMDPSNGNNAIGTPNKLFEALAYGIPLIVNEGTFSANLVRENDCGVVVEGSSEGLRKGIEGVSDPKARERMGRNGRKAAETRYNWGLMKSRLLGVYSKLK